MVEIEFERLSKARVKETSKLEFQEPEIGNITNRNRICIQVNCGPVLKYT